jgi:hypothetical protein
MITSRYAFHTETTELLDLEKDIRVLSEFNPPVTIMHANTKNEYRLVAVASYQETILALYEPLYESEYELFARPFEMMFEPAFGYPRRFNVLS